ncbi:uncharacterized protein LOC131402214 isoform X4 [Diceros bicornis minor]|uniref:uncharacterized protein LOC131402214 isoform X4 n=1 Tax=Diceros bicornis minor TaxID=77932 RepID=UPI0026E97CE9|nr:uncharacterized protein LOC131402214 isoform X4 [Diceros bicornis minor]XP_058393080.1 uncharacterized protein LOC131402214 isoform X4 [Diceros bicornis minor]
MGRWGAIFGQEALVMGHSGVGWAVPGRVAELAPSAGGALHVCPPESNPQRVQEKQQQQQEYRVMREILLLQVAAKNYNKTPRSDLGPGSRTWSCSTRMSQTPRVEVFKRSSLIYLRVWQAYLWMFKPDIARRTTSLHP